MAESKQGLVIGAVAAVAIGGVFLLKRSHKAPVPPPVEETPAPAPAPAPPAPAPAPPPTPVVLPTLEKSDDFIRDRAAGASSNTNLADWLKSDDLIRRLTAAAEVMASGKIPRDSLGFLAPKKKFAVVKNGGKIFVDPKTYARYDALGGAVESINASAAAKLFTDVKPLLQQACQELGKRSCDVQGAVVGDIKSLLQVPQVDGMLRLRMKIVTWEMTDSKLEQLTAAQKVVVRMGPKNAAKVQAKLREFAKALGASDRELPQPQTYAPKID